MTLTAPLTRPIIGSITAGLLSAGGQNMLDRDDLTYGATVDFAWDADTQIMTRTGSGGSFYLANSPAWLKPGHRYRVSYMVSGWTGDSWKVNIDNGSHDGETQGNGYHSHVIYAGGTDPGQFKIFPWFGTACTMVVSNISVVQEDNGPLGLNLYTHAVPLGAITTGAWDYTPGTNIMVRTDTSGGCTFGLSSAQYSGTHCIDKYFYQLDYDVVDNSGDSWSIRMMEAGHQGEQSGTGHKTHIAQSDGSTESLTFIAWGGGVADQVFSNFNLRLIYDPEVPS